MPDHPGVDAHPHRDRLAVRVPRISMASAPALRSSLMTSSIVSAGTPGVVSVMVSITPGPVAATVPIRIDSAARRAWAFSIAAASLLPDACSCASVRCRSVDLGVERRLALLQRVQQHQQVGGPRGLQRIAGLGLPDLGDDRRHRAPRTAGPRARRTRSGSGRAAARRRRRRRAGRRSSARLVGRQLVAAVMLRRFLVAAGRRRRADSVLMRHAPNSLRRKAAALPKIRMPSTTMIAVDSWVPTPSWSPT